MRTRTVPVALAVLSAVAPAAVRAAADAPATPPAAAVPSGPARPTIISDTSQAPDLKEWAAKAEALCREWYSRFAQVLGAEESRLPKSLTIRYDPTYDGVAACYGDLVRVSPKWIREHPDDFGCILHELTHFQQAYPKYDPVWLVEGISDYARWFLFEPENKRPRPDPSKASSRDSYRTTGAFLDYVTRAYDKNIVRKLSRALKESRYDEAYWEELTGKSLDALNAEWLATLPKREAKPAAASATPAK